MTYFLDASEVRTSSLGDTSARRRLSRSRRFSLTHSYERCAFACVLFQLANLFSFLSLSTFRIRRLRCFAITLPLSFFRVFSAHTIRSPGTDRSTLSLSLSSRAPPHSFSPLVSTMLVIANTTPTTLAYFVAPSLFHSLPLSDDLNRFSFSDAHLSLLSLVHFAGPFLSLTP